MSNHFRRAPFIVVEGLDRSGKSTQVARLLTKIESLGIPVKVFKFPDRTTPIGQLIDSYLTSQTDLDDHAIHLLFAANRWELSSSIERLLSEGTIVLCDRYAFSGVAFSASKPHMSYPWCCAAETGLPAPDIVLFLNISPNDARSRAGYGVERYETETRQKFACAVFDRIAAELYPNSNTRWVTVDAGLERDAVTGMLWAEIEPVLNGVNRRIDRLWMQT